MNFMIERLNAWGPPAMGFAGAMLWQSSLLILLLLAVEWACGRKLRPGLRYLLWLVVLLKLLSPPSLALPSGVGWWVRPSAHRPAGPVDQRMLVTYGPTAPVVGQSGMLPEMQRPSLSTEGGLLAVSVVVTFGLLAFIAWRWVQVAKQAGRVNQNAPEWLKPLLEESCRLAGVRRAVALGVVRGAVSPALFGLFKPVILLPEELAERFSHAQLRSVLLHELIHLRRADVWVNCAQALLQIAYWWHPLVWLANHRVRRAREEAVDEAVMLALRDEAENYAPTLVEVARLAFTRPLASLGLVGIFESHRALRKRIERLIDFRPPGRAALTLRSLVWTALFGAVALPMGQAPARNASRNQPGSQQISAAKLVTRSNRAEAGAFAEDGKLLYEMGKLDEAEQKLWQALQVDPREQAAYYYLHLIKEARRKQSGPAWKGNEAPPLYVRIIKVDPNTFERGLRSVMGQPQDTDPDTTKLLKNFLASINVDLSSPKTVFYNARELSLFVRTTLPDLDTVETAVQALSLAPRQLNIKAKFIEVSEADEATFWAKHGEQTSGTTARTLQLTSDEALRDMGELRSKPGSEFLAESSVTTLSGRQCEVQVVDLKSIATFTNWPQGHWETNVVPLGPTLDVLPVLSLDGATVELSLKPMVKEFLGYEAAGFGVPSQPKFRVRQRSVHASVGDGRTLVLGQFQDEQNQPAEQPADGKKRLLVFITPTVIDAAGNAVRAEQQSLNGNSGPVRLWHPTVPPQPAK